MFLDYNEAMAATPDEIASVSRTIDYFNSLIEQQKAKGLPLAWAHYRYLEHARQFRETVPAGEKTVMQTAVEWVEAQLVELADWLQDKPADQRGSDSSGFVTDAIDDDPVTETFPLILDLAEARRVLALHPRNVVVFDVDSKMYIRRGKQDVAELWYQPFEQLVVDMVQVRTSLWRQK